MTSANNGTNLTNVADNTKTIPTLSSAAGATPATLSDNTWGYKKDSGNYIPFTTNTTILQNNTRTNEDATTLSFAAKVDYTKQAGLYEQDLVFTVTPNIVAYYMQDLDAAVCTKDPIEAIDTRDGNTYWVAELDDGNCWMLQNLQLGNTLATTSGSMTLTPDDSNVSENWVLNNKIPSPGNMPSTTIADDVSGGTAYVYDNNAFYCAPDGTNNYKSCYYNWYTATAGKGTSNVTGKNTTGVDVNDSICPRGWVLPKGGSDSTTNNFSILNSYYSTATDMLVSPSTAIDNVNGVSKPGFLASGYYTSIGFGGSGEVGDYWSRTTYSNGLGNYLVIFNTGSFDVNSQYRGGKYHGLPVRCLRETRTLLDIDNMQDISPAIVGNTNVGAFKALKDTRDNQYYMVGKLEDGNIWMLDNLNIDLFANKNVISPSNTHITGTVGINGLNAFNGTSVGTASDRYATGAIASTNSDASGNWTSTYSYSVPLQNRSGKCDPSKNSSYQCMAPYQNANYTYNKVIDKYGTPVADSSGTANVTYNIGHGNYKIGTYYNYCAATLGSYCYGNGTSVGTPSGNATEADICPLGWRIPTGGASGEYQSLCDAINGSACSPSQSMDATSPDSFQAKLSTPVSGNYLNGSAYRQGTYGYFWSSSYYNAATMHYGGAGGTGVYPQNNDNRNTGFSVRCLAR